MNAFADLKFAVTTKSLTTKSAFADANQNNAQILSTGVRSFAIASVLPKNAMMENSLLTTFASVSVKMMAHAQTTAHTGLTNSAIASVDQLPIPFLKANTGTLFTANSNVSSKSALPENTSELISMMQTTAVANAFHMSALMANTGTPTHAAVTASKAIAQPTKSGMLLPATASAWKHPTSLAANSSTGTLLTASANVQTKANVKTIRFSTTMTAVAFALILHKMR